VRAIAVLVLPFACVIAAGAAARAGDEALVAVARTARPSVVRVVWRDDRFGDLTVERNAIVIRADGLLLMAGPPPSRRGTLTVRFMDESEVRGRIIASDAETALTLLRVSRTKLAPLELRVEARKPAPPDDDPARVAPLAPERSPLPALPPLGLRVVMATGDGAVAMGPLRAHGRHGTVTDPDTRRKVRTTGLLGATLAAVDADVGSPFLDEAGRVVGLLVGRRAEIAPGDAAAAARAGLRQRPTAVEAVAVPARVVGLVWPLLEKHHRVPRAALGVTTIPMGSVLAGHLRLGGGGHVIRRLATAGTAERHGLRLHDVIVAVDGTAIRRGTSLHDVLLPFRPGARVRIEVIREGKNMGFPVLMGER